MLRKLTRDEVTFELTIEPEDIPVRGNYMSTDDPLADKEAEDRVLELLDRGFTEAWCYLKVTATYEGFNAFAGLGACCYEPNTSHTDIEADAEQYGLYDEALDNLNALLADIDSKLPREV